MNETTFLYALWDPRNGECRYVGKSDEPFQRFSRHLKDVLETPTSRWIQKLKALSLVPNMELLDEVPVCQWQFWEREYIRVYRAIGVRLLNLEDGGEGSSRGIKRSPESRARMSKAQLGNKNALGNKNSLGLRHSDETKHKMSVASLGRKKSFEHRKNISEARKGMKFSPEHCENIRRAKLKRD